MDQYGSQGKGSGYKKYFQKYMGSNGGGYERFMAVSLFEISSVSGLRLQLENVDQLTTEFFADGIEPITYGIPMDSHEFQSLCLEHHGKMNFPTIWAVL